MDAWTQITKIACVFITHTDRQNNKKHGRNVRIG